MSLLLQQIAPYFKISPDSIFSPNLILCPSGFDIIFCGKTLGKVRSTFSWILNDKHYNIVTVHADVVPIELILSKEEVVFEFPPESGIYLFLFILSPVPLSI